MPSKHSENYGFVNRDENKTSQKLVNRFCRSSYNYKNGLFVALKAWTDHIRSTIWIGKVLSLS